MSVATVEPFGLVALDGADDDGGTLYALLDEGRPVLSASWPHPLHRYAAEQGRGVVRVPAWTGATVDDIPDRKGRAMGTMIEDLSPTAATRKGCKVAGCGERALAERGPYGLLCEAHKAAKKAAGFRTGAAAAGPPPPPVPPVEEPADDERGPDDEPLTLAQAVQALTDTKALCDELARQLAEERENLATIADEVRRLALDEAGR